QVVEVQAEVRRVHGRRERQRVELRAQVAARAIGGDQAPDVALALVALLRPRRNQAARGLSAGLGYGGDHRGMRDITGLPPLETVEPGFPLRPDAVGRDEVLLVEVLDVGGIGAKLGGLRKLLEKTVHVGRLDSSWEGKLLIRKDF